MFFLDIETLSTKQDGVIVSVGLVYIANTDPKPFTDILKDSIFVKFDAAQQKALHRKADKSTMDWWKKQDHDTLKRNVLPSPDDLSPMDGITALKKFIYEKSGRITGHTCFTRGGMDAMMLDHLCIDSLEVKPLFPFWEYRDVRTAIEFLYPHNERSYVTIDEERCPGANAYMAMKHSPDIDAALDAAMILYGV